MTEDVPIESVTDSAPTPSETTPPTNIETAPVEGLGSYGKATLETPPPAEPPTDNQTNEWLSPPEGNYNLEGVIEPPEGQEFNTETLNELASVCSEMGLSQKAFANIINRLAPVMEQQQTQQIQSFRENNLKALAQDKDFGGANLQGNLQKANAIYQKYVSPDLQKMLTDTGLNTHPEVVRLFYNLSQVLSDDNLVRGGHAQKPSLANFFNNSNMR